MATSLERLRPALGTQITDCEQELGEEQVTQDPLGISRTSHSFGNSVMWSKGARTLASHTGAKSWMGTMVRNPVLLQLISSVHV